MGRDSLYRAGVLADRTQAREESYIVNTNPAANFQQGFNAMHTAGLREQAAAMDEVQAGMRQQLNQAKIQEIHQLADVREREGALRMQELQYKIATQEATLREKQIERQLAEDESNSPASIMRRINLTEDGGAEYGMVRNGQYVRTKLGADDTLTQIVRGGLQAQQVKNAADATQGQMEARGPTPVDRLTELNRSLQGFMTKNDMGEQSLPPEIEQKVAPLRSALLEAITGNESALLRHDQREEIIEALINRDPSLSYAQARERAMRIQAHMENSR